MNIRPRVIAGFIIKEFIQILRDRKMIGAIFFIPVIQLVMFGFALTSEVKNITLVMVSPPSKMARDIEARALASGWFSRVDINGAQIADPAELLTSQKAEAALVAPKEGFEYAFEHLDKPAQLLINAINAQRAQQVDGYIKQIVLQTARAQSPQFDAGRVGWRSRSKMAP